MINSSNNSTRIVFSTGVLIAVLFAVFVAPTRSADAAGEIAPNDISVLQQTVDIDYGTRINITTVVDPGSQPVEAVRALFKPRGGSTVWSYSYPDYSITSGQVSVNFEIPTGPGSYYPPGTDFDIEIEVTLANGEITLVRSPEPIEYLDPTKQWQRANGDGYTVVYYGVSTSDVQNLITQTNARIPMLKRVLGVTETPGFKAIVFPSIRDATPSFPPVSQTATDQFLFAGFAQPEYRLFVQGQMNPTTFVHELAHLYTHEAVRSSLLGGLPSWLSEGLARFLETGSSHSSIARLRASVRPDELLSLRHMGTIPGRRTDVFIFYPQAGAFVGYLIEEYGAATMVNFLASMNSGGTLLGNFETVYEKPLYEMENEWRAMLDAEPLVIPSATPQPDLSGGNDSPQSTPVPLIDYSSGSKQDSAQDSSAEDDVRSTPSTFPDYLPTPTPTFSIEPGMQVREDDPMSDYMVAGLVIGLSIFTGLWLFISRRSKLPERKS